MTSTAPFTRLSSSLMPNETAICGPTIELLLRARQRRRRPLVPRFPPLAAFERRPTRRVRTVARGPASETLHKTSPWWLAEERTLLRQCLCVILLPACATGSGRLLRAPLVCEAQSCSKRLGSAPGRPSFVLGRVPSVVALLHGGGRVFNALPGIQSGFGRELSQSSLAVQHPLHLALEQIHVGVQQLLWRAHRHQPGQTLCPLLCGLLRQLEDLAPEALVA